MPASRSSRFLAYSPYSDPRSYKQLIKDKIAADPSTGFKVLQAVLQVGGVLAGGSAAGGWRAGVLGLTWRGGS